MTTSTTTTPTERYITALGTMTAAELIEEHLTTAIKYGREMGAGCFTDATREEIALIETELRARLGG